MSKQPTKTLSQQATALAGVIPKSEKRLEAFRKIRELRKKTLQIKKEVAYNSQYRK